MSSLKINTFNNSLTVHHQNLSKNFKSDDSFSNKLTDRELYEIASFVPDKKMKHVSKNVLKTLLVAVPVMDIAMSALTRQGKLATKVKSAAIVTAFWTTAFATSMVVQKVKNVVNNNSKLLDDFNKHHPFTSTFVDLAVVFGIFKASLNGIHKIANTVKEALPEKTQVLQNNVVKPLKTYLNNSVANKKIVEPFENYMMKNPSTAKAFKITSFLAVPTVILATVLRFAAELSKRNENVENNFYILKAFNENLVHHMDEENID